MRLFRDMRRLRQRRRSAVRALAPTPGRRFERFVPNRQNRHWWIGGLIAVLVLTWLGRPADFRTREPDTVATEYAREIARKNTAPIYTLNRQEQIYAETIFRLIEDTRALTQLSIDEQQASLEQNPLVRFKLGSENLRRLLELSNADFLEIRQYTLQILDQVLSQGVVLGGHGEGSLWAELAAYFDPKYTTRWENVESMTIRIVPDDRVVKVDDLLTVEDALVEVERLVRAMPTGLSRSPEDDATIRRLVLDISRRFIAPNLTFDAVATAQKQAERAATVPMQYRTRYERPFVVYVGTFLVVSLFVLFSLLFLSSQFPVRNRDDRQLTTVATILVAGVVFLYLGVRLVARFNDLDYPVLMIPVATSAGLSSILLGIPFGIFSTILLTLLATLMTGVTSPESVPQLLVLFSTGFLASYTMANVHLRRDLAIAGLYTSLVGMLVAFGGVLILGNASGAEMIRVVGWAFVSGIIVTAVVPGILPLFESVAGTASDLELLDLSDFNHPLLVRLQKVAPGTYNHSLNVSRLAEAAAEAIGVNSLMARVGAYYHDIGKMNYPEYFIENQEGGPNPHDTLKPTMSAKILIAHVKNGAELAREHKLPKTIIDLIWQHHGTSLIRPFYHKAAEHGDDVDEADFRYPGPKPQSKVAAILMLADSIEPAANARFKNLAALGRRDCQQLVSDIVNHYVLDGQLDECDLTLNDVHLISESYEHTLVGMYHSRIEYPKEVRRPRPEEKVPLEDGTTV